MRPKIFFTTLFGVSAFLVAGAMFYGIYKVNQKTSEELNNFNYSFNKYGQLSIDGYKGLDKDVSIPESFIYNGQNISVEFIGGIDGFKDLDSIEIPSTVYRIESKAFMNSNIKSIVLNDGLKEVGDYCFAETPNLKSVQLPTTVSIVEHHAFENAKGLEYVKYNTDESSISNRLFAGCINLKSINIPKSITYFDKSKFENCNSLETLTFDYPVYWVYGVSSLNDDGRIIITEKKLTDSNAHNQALILKSSNFEYFKKTK